MSSSDQLNQWIEDGDRNSEYISIDDDYEYDLPDDSTVALSVAGLFTFLLSTAFPFTASLPPNYSHSASLNDFVGMINRAKGSTVATVLDAATRAYPKVADARDAEVAAEENGDGGALDGATQADDEAFFVQPATDPEALAKMAARREADRRLATMRELCAPQTSLPSHTIERLLKDLTHVQNSRHHGWSASPVNNNLALWEVLLFDFDKGTPLANDMAKLSATQASSSSGGAVAAAENAGRIVMHMKFPPEYPNKPPFIRVVNPRFMFRTGRVTVGGSICTELLVQEGWQPVYDIESIIESLRQQMTDAEAGARVDFSNTTPYTEAEAIEAFNRVAAQHGWSVM